MKKIKLSNGTSSFKEIEMYFNSNKKDNYILYIYDEMSQSTIKIICKFD